MCVLPIPIYTHAVSNFYLLLYYNIGLRLYFESHYILKYPCLSVMMSRCHWVVISHALPTIISMSQPFSGKCKFRKHGKESSNVVVIIYKRLCNFQLSRILALIYECVLVVSFALENI